MSLDLLVEADGEWDSSTDWQALARRSVEAALAESAFPALIDGSRPVELSLRLADDSAVRALNAQWRGKDRATNVLSFPLAGADELADPARAPELLLGDIILAHGVCRDEAAQKSVPITDHAAHLVVHGMLHLLGYDHMDDQSAADMEAREVRALARIGIDDPYSAEAR